MDRSRRSTTVCHRCHRRKTACDLQLASGPNAKCSACRAAGAECSLRPSNKGRRLKRKPEDSPADDTRSISRDLSHASPSGPAYLGEMSFHTLLSPNDGQSRDDNRFESDNFTAAEHSNGVAAHLDTRPIDDVPPRIRQSSLETYHEFFYVWCPVLDIESGTEANSDTQSNLVSHALALLHGSFRPPLTAHASPAEHYARARQLFYSKEPIEALRRLRACMLFYWWSTAAPNVVSMDNSFWWAGVAIRLAQQIGLHREPKPEDSGAGLRRRIWWTLYARDRIISWCQGRPCMIDEDYCDVRPPLPGDFPDGKAREADIFIQWVRLSVTIGHLNKELFRARRTEGSIDTVPLANELVDWICSIPAHLFLPLTDENAIPYDRDVFQLYLPYLTTISLIYLQPTDIRPPGASVAAVLAAACTSRIIEEFLARGCLDFLAGEVGWYMAVAILALMPVRSVQKLKPHAVAHIRTLLIALKHMARRWHSSKMLYAGISKVLESDTSNGSQNGPSQALETHGTRSTAQPTSLDQLCARDGVIWAEFFPFASEKTSPLVGAILVECQHSFPDLWPHEDWPVDLDEMLEELRDFPFEGDLAPAV